MASRAPLLVAAALFFVGVAGLLATVPGREVGGAFVPLVHSGPNPTAQSPLNVGPTVPALTFFVPTAVPSRNLGVVEDATVPPKPTVEAPKPTPTPVLHSAVVAAVANDVSPTPSAPHPVMISSDGDGETATATPTAQASTSPDASGTPAATSSATPTATPAP